MKIEHKIAKVLENNNIDPIILSILLKDRTTNKNIIWATDNYKEQDKKYTAKKQITMEAITTEKIIKPRLGKTQIEQENRSRDKAEVFTPSWMCNIQNNLVDEMWFGKKDVFNKELSKSWKANKQKVAFPENKTWQEYIKSVRLLLKDCENIKELGKGMHGVLANIIEVPEEYQTAIEMCLGASLQNIVTETEEDAKKLVEHLRKNNLGRASFLPITSVKGKKIEKIKGQEKGIIGIASDLIRYSKKYEQIVTNLLGRTVIVDNMDTAIKVAKQNSYTFRIITIEGDVINPSGAITGGSVSKKTVNILGRGREIEKLQKEIASLGEKIKKQEQEKEEYKKSIEVIFEEASSLEKELQEIDITYATEKQKLVSVEKNISKVEQRVNKLKEEKEKIREEKEKAIENKEKIQEEISKITEETEKLSNVIQEFSEVNKDNQKYVDDLNFDITNLKISVSSFDESEASIEEIQERIIAEVNNTNKSIENKAKQIEKIEGDNINLKETIVETEEKIGKIKEELKTSGSKKEELKQERKDKNEI